VALRAIIFDFDGVLADSEPLHYRAFRDVLAEDGIELTEPEYYARYLGFSDAGAFRTIDADRRLGWSGEQIAALGARKALRFEQIARDRSVLFPGAAAAILRAADAVPIAIASGALREEIVGALEAANLVQHFTAIVAAGETPASKPAPDPYRHAVELLRAAGHQVQPHECVAIEDSPWGLESARAAGLFTVAVQHSYQTSALTADLFMADISALDVSILHRLCT
jgi:HAD superfamily hydrolase (TIGR01509 family)